MRFHCFPNHHILFRLPPDFMESGLHNAVPNDIKTPPVGIPAHSDSEEKVLIWFRSKSITFSDIMQRVFGQQLKPTERTKLCLPTK